MEGSFELHARLDRDARTARPAAGGPFRLLVLADFSGRASRGVREPLTGRRPRRVDRDDLEKVFGALAPELELATRAPGEVRRLELSSLDDLHPDALWERLGEFARLRSLRRRLSDPETFAEAAAEIGAATPVEPPAAPPVPADRPHPDGLLERTLQATDAPGGTGSELVDAIVRELVIPRVPPTPGQEDLIAGVDAAAADEMRDLLSQPEVRRLEAAWRAVEFLVRRLETDEELQVWLLDVSADELVRDAVENEDPRSSGAWRALFEPDAADAAGGGARWAAWVALDLSFGASVAQAALLARLARLAAAAGSPLLASAREELAGCPSVYERPDPHEWDALDEEAGRAWSTLRGREDARWVLLALPRLLLRAPYGQRTNPLERFRFEELHEPAGHADFLWGSGAVAAAVALGQAYSENGWSLATEGVWELDRLPVPVYTADAGESEVKPAAEVVLTDRAAETLRELGLVPLASVRDTDRVRIGPLRSLAGEPLAGPWTG